MSIRIITGNQYPKEKQYILETIFNHFWDLPIEIERKNTNLTHYEIHIGNAIVQLPDQLFQTPNNKWLTPESLPETPLKTTPLPKELQNDHTTLPILYGTNKKNTTYTLPIDIFGSIFFMLTRYEECCLKENPTAWDNWGRFKYENSLAYKENFLMRPIVNEYLELLWHALQSIAPDLKRKAHSFSKKISCDVDHPVHPSYLSLTIALRLGIKSLLKEQTIRPLINHIKRYLNRNSSDYKTDPYYTFDWMMSACEQEKLPIAFYFICDSPTKMDALYTLNTPLIQSLLKEIHTRGHEIGIHGSYLTYNNPKQFQKEYTQLQTTCKNLGISQSEWGGRQHLLRWEAPTTWTVWNGTGIDYDSTVGYGEHIGFRTGTCYDYPVFDLLKQQALPLIERPLIVMENTLFEPRYMNLEYSDATLNKVKTLVDSCRHYNGNFTLLWHNSYFTKPEQKTFFLECLRL